MGASMKRIVAGVLTVALMGVLIWSGRGRQAGRNGPGTGRADVPDPVEARLNTLLDDAWRGDVPGYLDSFSGPLRERLEREVNERGRDAFAADLRRSARSRKSHAVFAVEPEGDSAARITVETVYPDRNERQTYHLARESGGWLVDDVETVRSQVPKARFGAEASYQEPEGVPVQGLAVQGIPLRVETDTDTDTDANAIAGDDGPGTAPVPKP
jgi:hypothetical protein